MNFFMQVMLEMIDLTSWCIFRLSIFLFSVITYIGVFFFFLFNQQPRYCSLNKPVLVKKYTYYNYSMMVFNALTMVFLALLILIIKRKLKPLDSSYTAYTHLLPVSSHQLAYLLVYLED